ncbi:MAG: M15 family metallopeptidase [Flavobacteriales bacterium]
MFPDKELLLGQVDPTQDHRFVSFVNENHETHWLLKETFLALSDMITHAKAQDIELNVISSTRNFERQKMIWERKWNGLTEVSGFTRDVFLTLPGMEKAKAIMRYSAMPGTSRHHWGTDVDLNSVEPEYFETEEGKKVLNWLDNNALQFGFYRSYTEKGYKRLTGYEAEPWHWSYFPKASTMLASYNALIDYADISRFDGCEHARPLRVIEDYVNGVAKVKS